MSKRFRFFLILLVLAFSGTFLYPTISWYFFTPKEKQELAASSREKIRELARSESQKQLESLKTLFQKTPDAVLPAEFSFLLDRAKENYKNKGLAEPAAWTMSAFKAGFNGPDEIGTLLEARFRDDVLKLKEMKTRILQLGLDLSGGMNVVLSADLGALEEKRGRVLTEQEKEDAVGRALEILASRIDQFGVTEPSIQRERGGNKIFVDIPGDVDPDRVSTFLKGKGSLALNVVDDEATQRVDLWVSQNPDKVDPLTKELRDLPPDLVPAGLQLRSFFKRDQYGIDQFVRYEVVKTDDKFVLDGVHIQSADISRDPITNQPVVNFVLDQAGGEKFFKLTQDNVGKTLAVVLDEKIKAGARIAEAIPNGSVRMSGFDQKEATDLSKTLRTGALPVSFTVLTQQAIGPTLGADAINSGINASLYGFLLVAVFMLLYYKGAGINANLALVLNMVIVVAVLSVFNLTITLASIASLVLTVGMSVDANVIVFERIKEEYWQGKSPAHSIKIGFDRAFWTIMDSHVTALIAAFFLSQLAKGPVQGFAVTLAVGMVSSIFTALFVSKLLFDFRLEVLRAKRLSITWRKM